MGPKHRWPHQEEDVSFAGGRHQFCRRKKRAGGEGSQTQPPGPGVPLVGAVGVWKAVGGSGDLGNWRGG